MEKISVLIPVYNREIFAVEAVKSACSQTYENLDIIVFDDGSTDSTIEKIKAINDSRIRIINGGINKGIGHARNELINACKTRYACWLDSDDVIVNNKIEEQFSKMNIEKIVFSDWRWLKLIKDQWVINKNKPSIPAFATAMFPVNKNVKFNVKQQFGGEDWSWLNVMFKIYPSETHDKILYYVRGHENRIGCWKRKIRKKFRNEEIVKYSYSELIERYKKENK